MFLCKNQKLQLRLCPCERARGQQSVGRAETEQSSYLERVGMMAWKSFIRSSPSTLNAFYASAFCGRKHITLWQCDQNGWNVQRLAFLFNFNMCLKITTTTAHTHTLIPGERNKRGNYSSAKEAVRTNDKVFFPLCHRMAWNRHHRLHFSVQPVKSWRVDYGLHGISVIVILIIVVGAEVVRLILHTFKCDLRNVND